MGYGGKDGTKDGSKDNSKDGNDKGREKTKECFEKPSEGTEMASLGTVHEPKWMNEDINKDQFSNNYSLRKPDSIFSF